MAVTVSAFVDAHPEFARTDPGLIEQCLAQATRRVAPAVWGERTDDGVMLLAAHLLWSSPFGTTTRLDAERDSKEKSRYWTEFKQLARELGAHFAVT